MSSNAEAFGMQVKQLIELGSRLDLKVMVRVEPGHGGMAPLPADTSSPVAPVTPKVSVEEAVTVPRQGSFTQENVERLVEAVVHLPGAIALFRSTSDRPGEWVTYREVVEAAGLGAPVVQGQLSALSRHAVRVLGRKAWPVEWQTDADGKFVYRALPRIAEWLQRALNDR
jgi:hypothetical protein